MESIQRHLSCPHSGLLAGWFPDEPTCHSCPLSMFHANGLTSGPLGVLSVGQRQMTQGSNWEWTMSSVGKGYFLMVVF